MDVNNPIPYARAYNYQKLVETSHTKDSTNLFTLLAAIPFIA